MTGTRARENPRGRRAIAAGKFVLFMLIWLVAVRLIAHAAVGQSFGERFWRSMFGWRVLLFAAASVLAGLYAGPFLFPARRPTEARP